MKNELELWGGIECTVNPTGRKYSEQLELRKPSERVTDLDLIAQLGIKTLRYPVLWEQLAANGIGNIDWSHVDAAMQRMRALRINPIIELMHHDCGPPYSSLEDDRFPEKLAEFASAVARRYPWVSQYNPISEPLLTARFSGLYGLWRPQKRDGLSFAKMMVNQCRAVVFAIRAIRAVAPGAKLIQVEDIARTYSTPRLSYQADFENERRWLTFDLLCGRVFKGHPMHHHLRWLGMTLWDLDWFLSNPCPPDIIGLNFNLSSQRYLDERLDLYPAITHGGNDREPYADVEAVHAVGQGFMGVSELLEEAWDRYRKPMALTEVSMSGTFEQQEAWLCECWDAAKEAVRNGQLVRGVTVWGLFGGYDRSSLLTQVTPNYEPGALDLRVIPPAKTPLSDLVLALATTGRHTVAHPEDVAWWRSPKRLTYHSDQQGRRSA